MIKEKTEKEIHLIIAKKQYEIDKLNIELTFINDSKDNTKIGFNIN